MTELLEAELDALERSLMETNEANVSVREHVMAHMPGKGNGYALCILLVVCALIGILLYLTKPSFLLKKDKKKKLVLDYKKFIPLLLGLLVLAGIAYYFLL